MKTLIYLLLQALLLDCINAVDKDDESAGLLIKNIDPTVKNLLRGFESFENVIKVVSWSLSSEKQNERIYNGTKDVCDFLNKMNPTIFCLQQVLPRQLADLENCLASYDLVHPTISTEVGGKGYFNPIFTKKDNRLSQRSSGVSSGAFWLSETPTIRGSKLQKSRYQIDVSMATWVKLSFTYKAKIYVDHASNKKIHFLLNTFTNGSKTKLKNDVRKEHYKNHQTQERLVTTNFYVVNVQLEPSYSEYVRKEQINILLSTIKDVVMDRRRFHVILTGNYNAKDISEDIKRFDWLRDTVKDSRSSYPAFSLFDSVGGGGLVDYIWQDKFESILSATLVDEQHNGESLSEHRPILAVLIPYKQNKK